MIPFLKWAGGKRWLIQHGLPQPAQYDRYIEPFLGGGAVFFALEPRSSIISDVNPELINLYSVIRDSPSSLSKVLSWHQVKHSKEHFYTVRSRTYKDPTWRAARTLYLNRTCWNGLYRLNKRGAFNVPIGTKLAVMMDTDDFVSASALLKRAELHCRDFDETICSAGAGDFLFVDPPYTVKHNMNGFVKYNETIFAWEDQIRLQRALQAASDRGAHVVLTNADHPSVRDLYGSSFEFRAIERQSVLAGSGKARGRTTEAIFTSNI